MPFLSLSLSLSLSLPPSENPAAACVQVIFGPPPCNVPFHCAVGAVGRWTELFRLQKQRLPAARPSRPEESVDSLKLPRTHLFGPAYRFGGYAGLDRLHHTEHAVTCPF